MIFANINPVHKLFKLKLPKVNQEFSVKAKIKQVSRLTRFETLNLIKNPYFLGILATGILFIAMLMTSLGKMYGTTTYPVTYNVIEVLSAFALFVHIIIIFLSGEIVWNERSFKVNEIVDSLPIPTWSIYTSKLAALFVVQIILMTLILIIGVIGPVLIRMVISLWIYLMLLMEQLAI